MEHYKISKLLNDSTVSKFVTKRWIEVNDLSIGKYSANKNLRFKTSMLQLDLYNQGCSQKFLAQTVSFSKLKAKGLYDTLKVYPTQLGVSEIPIETLIFIPIILVVLVSTKSLS